MFFVFKQKAAYEMRISDWSSDVCSSDLIEGPRSQLPPRGGVLHRRIGTARGPDTGAGGAESLAAAAQPHPRGGLPARRRPRPEQGQRGAAGEIGRASCRERVCQYVKISVVAETLRKQKHKNIREN